MKLKKLYQLVLLLLVVALLPGCMSDDYSVCPPFWGNLQLRFHPSPADGNDMQMTDVETLDVYVFDEAGIYREVYREQPNLSDPNYRMQLSLPPGTYSFIAWGNSSNRDYATVPLNFEPGVTALAEAKLFVQQITNNRIEHTLPHLFHGEQLAVEVPEYSTQEVPIPTVQNTYTFDVQIAVAPVAGEPLRVVIEADHNGYDFRNQPLNTANFEYSLYTVPAGTEQKALLRTLRIEESSAVQFNVYRWGDTRLYSESLLQLLRTAANNSGTPLDLSRKHHYTIRLNFDQTSGQFTVTVDGWNATEENTQISPQG